MKRTFTSFLLAAASLAATWAVAAEPEYAKPEEWRNNRSNPSDRLVYGMTLKGATLSGEAKSYDIRLNDRGGSQQYVYVDKTSEVLDLSANDQIKVELDHGIEWMHSYLYIDYNSDGIFDEDKELVSFSFYSSNDSQWGQNSIGQTVKNGNKTLDLPNFIIPADVQNVTTRMRLKIDWNSKNPVGNTAQNNSIGANRGSIFDFTVNLHGLSIEKYTVTIDDAVEGASLQVTDHEGLAVISGTEVEKGTALTVNHELEDVAYQFNGYTLNGIPFTGNTFTVNEPSLVSANVVLKSFTLNVTQPENGIVSIVKVDDLNGTETPVNSGDKVVYYDQLTVKTTPAEGYQLKSVLVNGQEVTENVILVKEDLAQNGAINVSAIFEQIPVVEPTYEGPSAEHNVRNRDDRRLKNIMIEGATLNGQVQTFDFTLNNDPQPTVYMDESSTILEATAGDQINVSWNFRTNTEWTHYYLYIDYNHDGVFNEENELVSFTYYSETDGDGVNSLGEVVPASKRGVRMTKLPQFQIPESMGNVKTRIRFKADWNSKNPLGNPEQSIGANGGTMVDFTINIHKKGTDTHKKYAILLNESVHGTFKVVNADGTVISNGEDVAEGTELTVQATPEKGYRVKEILVNDKPIQEGNTFTVTEASTVKVVFEEDVQMWAINFHATEGGTITVLNEYGGELQSGDRVKNGAIIGGCRLKEDAGYTLTSIKVNGREMVENVMHIMGQILLEISEPIHADLNIEVVFTANGQIVTKHAMVLKESVHGSYKVLDASGNQIFDGDKIAEGTELSVEVTPDEGYQVKTISVNGKSIQSGEKFQIKEATTIEVTFEEVMQMCAITFEKESVGGFIQVFDENNQEIVSGQEVMKGSKLHVEANPNDGYALKQISVNDGTVANNAEFVVTGPTTIQAVFEATTDVWTVHLDVTEGGKVVLSDMDGKFYKDGDKIKNATRLEGLKITEDPGYKLTTLTINGEDMMKNLMYAPGNVIILLYEGPVKSDLNVTVEFTVETGISDVTLSDANYDVESQCLVVPAGSHIVVYNAAGQQVMNVQANQSISTSALSKGVYLARIASEGSVKVIKFMKK